MSVHWIRGERAYEIKEKLSNGQTIFIQFQELEDSKDCKNYNICLGIYNKRKHAVVNEDECRITGEAPFLNVYKAIKMFDEIESYVIEDNVRRGYNVRSQLAGQTTDVVMLILKSSLKEDMTLKFFGARSSL